MPANFPSVRMPAPLKHVGEPLDAPILQEIRLDPAHETIVISHPEVYVGIQAAVHRHGVGLGRASETEQGLATIISHCDAGVFIGPVGLLPRGRLGARRRIRLRGPENDLGTGLRRNRHLVVGPLRRLGSEGPSRHERLAQKGEVDVALEEKAEGRETDDDIDHARDLRASNETHQILSSDAYGQPVDSADKHESYHNHVKLLLQIYGGQVTHF